MAALSTRSAFGFFTMVNDRGEPISQTITVPITSLTLDGVEIITPKEPTMEASDIPSRPTKAAMLALIEERDAERRRAERSDAELRAAQAERDEWRAVKISDPEAEALSGCVRAIEALLSAQSSRVESSSYGMSSRYEPPAPSDTQIGRILLHLAARYGIQLDPAQPQADTDEPTVVTVPRSIAEQLARSGQAL